MDRLVPRPFTKVNPNINANVALFGFVNASGGPHAVRLQVQPATWSGNVNRAESRNDRQVHECRGGLSARSDREYLIRVADQFAASSRSWVSRSRLRVLVRLYIGQVARGWELNPWVFVDYLANALRGSEGVRRSAREDPALARVIGYADPTGETAVRHVMVAAKK
jgi:hypothetical protein